MVWKKCPYKKSEMKADACISEMAIYLMNTIMSIGLLKLYL